MKTFLLTISLILCCGLIGCHVTHTDEVRHEPSPPQQTYQPQPVPKQEPVREVIIEERTTTHVVDEYEVVDGTRQRKTTSPRKTYSEDEYEDGSTRERVISEETVVD